MITTKVNRKLKVLEFYRDGIFVRSADLKDAEDVKRVRAELGLV